jgi:hypothetical protein
MMIRSKLFVSLIATLFVASSAFAATVTVGPNGTFATINAALESLDYNDGQADVLVLESGVVFDEQVVPKGNAGADSTAFPRATGMSVAGFQAAVQSHSDPLTIRSQDSSNPAVITKTTSTPPASFYGMFPADPGDAFTAALVMCGVDITIEGVELRFGNHGGYFMNGMAADFTFQDCLFTHGTTNAQRAEDYCDWNNNYENHSDINPLIGLDNTYVFDGCLIDGLSQENGTDLFDSSFIWFHGYGNSTPVKDEVTTMAFSNCVMRNWDDIIYQSRGNSPIGSGPLSTVVEDCFSYNMPGQFMEFRGQQGSALYNRNVIQTSGNSGFRVRDRDQGQIRQADVVNNLFVSNGNGNIVQIENNGSTNGWTINVVNNTFYGYLTAINQEAGSNAACVLNVANNIFAGTGTAVNGAGFATITATLTNNGFFNNTADVVGAPSGGNNGAVAGDPGFAADSSGGFPAVGGPTDVNLVAAPLSGSDFTDRVGRQNFLPTSNSYIDGGSNAAYNVANYGDVDVDSLDARVQGASIDIGAQETGGQSVVTSWDMY